MSEQQFESSLNDGQIEALCDAFVESNRAELLDTDFDLPILRAVEVVAADEWDAAMKAVETRIFNSYSHGHERGEVWVPFMADLIRSLQNQPIPNPHARAATQSESAPTPESKDATDE